MPRSEYIIIRVDHRCTPASLAYWATGDTYATGSEHGPKRWASFRESADRFTSKREAIREARRLSAVFPGQIKVNRVNAGAFGGTVSTVWERIA